jgi:hypothetical protein
LEALKKILKITNDKMIFVMDGKNEVPEITVPNAIQKRGSSFL